MGATVDNVGGRHARGDFERPWGYKVVDQESRGEAARPKTRCRVVDGLVSVVGMPVPGNGEVILACFRVNRKGSVAWLVGEVKALWAPFFEV